MKYTIFDTPDDVTKKISALKKAGITAIMRYDDPSGNAHSWKQIGRPEYNSILAAGIAVAIISEWANNHVGYFNAAIRPKAPCCRIQGRLLRFGIYQRKTQSRRTDRL